MKSLSKVLLAIFALAIVTAGFYSCDEPTDSDLTATVTVNKSIFKNGDTVKIMIDAVTTNDKIMTVEVKKGANALVAPNITDNKAYKETVNYIVNDADGEIEFTVTITGETMVDPMMKTIKINVVSGVEVTLGASSSPLPSFVNGTTLQTYTSTEAFANQAAVDLVYTWKATEGAIIGAPSDAAFTLANWTTKNATKIGKIADMTIEAVNAVTTTVVTNLVVGDMLGYITVGGTKGIIIVKNIVVNADGNVTYTFMVIK